MTEAPRHIVMQHDSIIDLIDSTTGIPHH